MKEEEEVIVEEVKLITSAIFEMLIQDDMPEFTPNVLLVALARTLSLVAVEIFDVHNAKEGSPMYKHSDDGLSITIAKQTGEEAVKSALQNETKH
jgi:hypothetical protein